MLLKGVKKMVKYFIFYDKLYLSYKPVWICYLVSLQFVVNRDVTFQETFIYI